MSLALFFNFFLILVSPAQAIHPSGMYHPKNIALKLKKDKYHECNDRFKVLPDKLSMYSFSTSIECQYQCKSDQNKQNVEISNYFDPEEQGLKQGDGYTTKSRIFLASFSTVFFNWSTKTCIELGIQKCGSIENVKEADFKKITSGNWSISEKPSCNSGKILYSPYDQQFKLNTSKESVKNASKTALTIPEAEETKSCRFPLKGNVCYGDCMIFDENDESYPRKPSPLVLMDKESPGNSEEEVCGDSLFNSFKGQSISAPLAESICQNFFSSSLVKKNIQGTSCAAFRGKANCSKFIKKMTKSHQPKS